MNPSLYLRNISVFGEISKGDYIRELPVVRHLQKAPLKLHSPVSFFVGENGVGKSTLIEAIAVSMGFNPEGGSRNFTFSTRKTHSDLADYLRIGKGGHPKDGFFLRAESFYNVATNIDEMDEAPGLGGFVIDSYGGVSLHEQSHGESFLALVQNRFGGNGLYILDEPEAALSPMRLLTLLCLIDDLVKKQSQFIISTHSPILMSYPGAEVFEISENGIHATPFRETEHYRITKRFLDDLEGMLQRLLEP